MLAFGEPEGLDPQGVIDFLERIFLANRRLEPGTGAERARQLAEARAPGLMEAYERIGGSPMNAHAEAHGEALEAALKERGHRCHVFVGTQFTTPTISDALRRCRESGVDQLVALPLYPVSGPTTTVAALDTVREQLRDILKNLRVGHLMVLAHFGDMPREKTMYNTKLIAEEVIPHLRDIWPEYEDHWYPKPLAEQDMKMPAAVGSNGK